MNPEAFQQALAAVPYGRFLAVEATDQAPYEAVMRFAPHLVGNPILPALHGGAVAGFMELAATAAVVAHSARKHRPKPIDVSIAYLRSGRPVDTFARVVIRKAGRRVAYVHVLAWQEDPAAPIAEMTAHFLLSDEIDAAAKS